MRWDAWMRAEVLEQYFEGKSQKDIAAEAGVSQQRIAEVINQARVERECEDLGMLWPPTRVRNSVRGMMSRFANNTETFVTIGEIDDTLKACDRVKQKVPGLGPYCRTTLFAMLNTWGAEKVVYLGNPQEFWS